MELDKKPGISKYLLFLFYMDLYFFWTPIWISRENLVSKCSRSLIKNQLNLRFTKMVININTTRFPSEISFRSDCINNFDTSHSRLNNGIRSCCSFWSSLMCSLHRCTQVYTHYTVQTTHSIPCRLHTLHGIECVVCTSSPHSIPYRVCSLHKVSTHYTV